MVLSLLVPLCMLFLSSTDAGGINCNLSPISNCPLHSFESDIVTPQEMIDQNVMGVHWLMIYYSQFDPHQSYGKCNFRWNQPDADGVVHRELMCYNIDEKKCESFSNRVTRKVDSCGRVEENAVNATMDGKFYSQNISEYFWYDSCYTYTESGDCDVGYLDLLVRGRRYPDEPDQELDLQGLPWQLISADLKNNFNMDISDIQMKFSWKGPECGFDGELKTTSGALQWGVNYLALVLILLFTVV